jgi:DNA helicase-2/ATP-dependent DNA helicase PcrA
MTRAMNTLILTRANFRRRYGNDAPEMSIPSRVLEEVPNQLIENLGTTRAPAWAYAGSAAGYGGYGARYGSGYGTGRRSASDNEFDGRHFNYEDENQETPRSPKLTSAPPKNKSPEGGGGSIDNIARFFGGKAGAIKPASFARPAMDIPPPSGSTGLKKGERVRHSKYGEGTILLREGDGEDAKLTVMFARHGIKKLMEKFANLEKL